MLKHPKIFTKKTIRKSPEKVQMTAKIDWLFYILYLRLFITNKSIICYIFEHHHVIYVLWMAWNKRLLRYCQKHFTSQTGDKYRSFKLTHIQVHSSIIRLQCKHKNIKSHLLLLFVCDKHIFMKFVFSSSENTWENAIKKDANMT